MGYRRWAASDEQSREQYRIPLCLTGRIFIAGNQSGRGYCIPVLDVGELSGLSIIAGYNEVTDCAAELSKSLDILCEVNEVQKLQAIVSGRLSLPGYRAG